MPVDFSRGSLRCQIRAHSPEGEIIADLTSDEDGGITLSELDSGTAKLDLLTADLPAGFHPYDIEWTYENDEGVTVVRTFLTGTISVVQGTTK